MNHKTPSEIAATMTAEQIRAAIAQIDDDLQAVESARLQLGMRRSELMKRQKDLYRGLDEQLYRERLAKEQP